MEKHAENVHQKLVPDPFLILVYNPKQPLHARNSFKSKILKEDYQKALKKLILSLFVLKNLFGEASSLSFYLQTHLQNCTVINI